MNHFNIRRVALIAGFLFATCGCASTKLTSTWRDPNFAGPIQFKKIVVLAVHPDRIARISAENEMVKQIGADRATQGYKVVSDEDRKNVEVLKSKLKQQGFDGAVTMKLLGARSASAYRANPSNSTSFDEDYNAVVSAAPSDAASEVGTTIIRVQTNIYSGPDGRLIWSGTNDVPDPKDAQQIVAEVAKSVRQELRKENLLP